MAKKHSTMLGLAVGDALGQPFEFASIDAIIRSGWDGSMIYGDVWRLQPGQWTDDTKMALCIAESLLEQKEFQLSHVAQKYVEWVETGDLRGIGNTCGAAIRRIAAGYPLDLCSPKPENPEPKNSEDIIFNGILIQRGMKDADLYGIGDFCGNGTVMRCAPIGS